MNRSMPGRPCWQPKEIVDQSYRGSLYDVGKCISRQNSHPRRLKIRLAMTYFQLEGRYEKVKADHGMHGFEVLAHSPAFCFQQVSPVSVLSVVQWQHFQEVRKKEGS